MNHSLIGATAAIIAAASVIPYLIGIRNGSTQPAQATYLVKPVVGATLVTSYFSVGARTTAWTMLVFTLSAIAVFVVSARRSVGHWTPIDRFVFAATALGLVAWHATGVPEVALYTTVALKWVALAPTLAKLHERPGTESLSSWLMALASDGLNLFALTSLRVPIALPAANEALLSAVVVMRIRRQANMGKRAQTFGDRDVTVPEGESLEARPRTLNTKSRV